MHHVALCIHDQVSYIHVAASVGACVLSSAGACAFESVVMNTRTDKGIIRSAPVMRQHHVLHQQHSLNNDALL